MLNFVVIGMLEAGRLDAARELSPSEIRTAIESTGAKAVVDRLSASREWWSLSKRVAAGEPSYIALAPALADGTDAGTSESLKISLAAALPKTPAAVLKVIDTTDRSPVLSLNEVCSSPFVEDEPIHRRTYKRITLKALAHVGDPKLQAVARACAAELRKVG